MNVCLKDDRILAVYQDDQNVAFQGLRAFSVAWCEVSRILRALQGGWDPFHEVATCRHLPPDGLIRPFSRAAVVSSSLPLLAEKDTEHI